MNHPSSLTLYRQLRQRLQGVTAVRTALHEALAAPGLDPVTRAHLERAYHHAREAFTAIQTPEGARNVPELAADLARLDQASSARRTGPVSIGV